MTCRFASSGVRAVSDESMGPALPSSLISPPPATCVENVNGNWAVVEKSRSSISTLSNSRGLVWPPAYPMRTFPLLIFRRCTERLAAAVVAGGSDVAAGAVFAPRVEKFQMPALVSRSTICGSSMVMRVTLTFREKTRAIRSTPTVRDLVCRKGSRLKAGSSAIVRSLAEMPPDNRASFRAPTFDGASEGGGELRFQLRAILIRDRRSKSGRRLPGRGARRRLRLRE